MSRDTYSLRRALQRIEKDPDHTMNAVEIAFNALKLFYDDIHDNGLPSGDDVERIDRELHLTRACQSVIEQIVHIREDAAKAADKDRAEYIADNRLRDYELAS